MSHLNRYIVQVGDIQSVYFFTLFYKTAATVRSLQCSGDLQLTPYGFVKYF